MTISMKSAIVIVTAFVLAISCKKDDPSPSGSSSVPTIFSTKFSPTVTLSMDGDNVVLKSNGVPNHKSPYFGKTDSRYEAYNGTNTSFAINPNSIKEQTLVFKIPSS